jgi:hypothetical protein
MSFWEEDRILDGMPDPGPCTWGDLRHPLLESLVNLLNEVKDQMMERMLRVEDGGAGRDGHAEFGDGAHFQLFPCISSNLTRAARIPWMSLRCRLPASR